MPLLLSSAVALPVVESVLVVTSSEQTIAKVGATGVVSGVPARSTIFGVIMPLLQPVDSLNTMCFNLFAQARGARKSCTNYGHFEQMTGYLAWGVLDSDAFRCVELRWGQRPHARQA